jgi:hypothetical protein
VIPALAAQLLFHRYMDTLRVSTGILPGWPAWVALALSCMLLAAMIKRTAGKALTQ